MTKKVFNLISLFISLIFAIAVAYFVIGTVIDVKSGPDRARISFIVILIATIIAVLVLIFAKEEPETDDNAEISFIDESENAGEKEYIAASVSDTENTAEPKREEEASVLEQEAEPYVQPAYSEAPQEQRDEQTDTSSKEEEASQEYIIPESRLNSTLEEELVKSAEKNDDLTLLIIKIDGLARAEKETEDITKILKETLGTDSQVFEYGDYSYAVLLRSTKLDDALSTAEELHSRITDSLKKSGAANSVTVGISSRTGRTLSGERLLTEAAQAQKHAETEPDSSIIAFRVNPEKYKELILNS